MRDRGKIRAAIKPRYWHIVICAILGTGTFLVADYAYIMKLQDLPSLKEIWVLAIIIPLICGAVVTLGAGGASLQRRVIGGAVCGSAMGVFHTTMSAIIGYGVLLEIGDMAINIVWRVFVFTIMSIIGVLLMEINLLDIKQGDQP